MHTILRHAASAFESPSRAPQTVGSYSRTKRVLDVSGALVLAAACVPLLAPIAMVIEFTTRGPWLYTQWRVGQGGRRFRIYKLRTMTDCAEADTGPVWAAVGDPRVTPIGRLLRATHLDELPQVFNVLAGDMSFIGPRPERPAFVSEFRLLIPRYETRHVVRPGMTGLAQIRQGCDRSVGDVRRKVAHDLEYIRNLGWMSDLRIVAATVLLVLRRRGGIATGPADPLTPANVTRHEAAPVW